MKNESPHRLFFYRFAGGLATGLFIAMVAYLAMVRLCFGVPTESSRWAYEINDKKKTLQQKVSGPRILIVGGSSTLFGIRAEIIEKSLGMRCINLSTHAALGTDYLMKLAQEAARPGDKVIVALEYPLYTQAKIDPKWSNALFTDYILARDPDYLKQLPLVEQFQFAMLLSFSRIKHGIKNRFKPDRKDPHPGIYDARLLNEFGDLTGHVATLRNPSSTGMRYRHTVPFNMEKTAYGFGPVGQFCDWAERNNIQVSAMWPALLLEPEFDTPPIQKTIQTITEFYRSHRVCVIGEFKTSVFPESHFFDTVYHLTYEKSKERTDELLPEIKRCLMGPSH